MQAMYHQGIVQNTHSRPQQVMGKPQQVPMKVQ